MPIKIYMPRYLYNLPLSYTMNKNTITGINAILDNVKVMLQYLISFMNIHVYICC